MKFRSSLSNKELFKPSDCWHSGTSNLDKSLGAVFCVVEISSWPCRSKSKIHLVLSRLLEDLHHSIPIPMSVDLFLGFLG